MSNFLKEEKRQSLLESANQLFLEKGVLATTIGEIAAQAKVAKGSFYLYFKDKDDIFAALVNRLSRRIISEAYAAMEPHRTDDFTENVILFVDYIIEYFKREPSVLRMMDRKFSWPLMEAALEESGDPVMTGLTAAVLSSPLMQHHSVEEIRRLTYTLVEMVGTVCYNSILKKIPAPIDEMKPTLYAIIRGSLAEPAAQNAPAR